MTSATTAVSTTLPFRSYYLAKAELTTDRLAGVVNRVATLTYGASLKVDFSEYLGRGYSVTGGGAEGGGLSLTVQYYSSSIGAAGTGEFQFQITSRGVLVPTTVKKKGVAGVFVEIGGVRPIITIANPVLTSRDTGRPWV